MAQYKTQVIRHKSGTAYSSVNNLEVDPYTGGGDRIRTDAMFNRSTEYLVLECDMNAQISCQYIIVYGIFVVLLEIISYS